jgi:autotransporter-associated beta strand protein
LGNNVDTVAGVLNINNGGKWIFTNTGTGLGFILGRDKGTGTLNLHQGGTFETDVAVQDSNSQDNGTAIVNLNGGTIIVTQTLATDLFYKSKAGSSYTVNILAGGAIIDTQGNSVTIGTGTNKVGLTGGASDGGLTKKGPGTLTLGATNTYTGITRIEEGSLIFDNATLPSTSHLEIVDGARLGLNSGTGTLTLNNSNTSFAGHSTGTVTDIDGSLSLSGGHKLNIGTATGFETLAISQSLSLDNATLNIQLTGLATYDKIELGDTLTATGNNTLNIDLLGTTTLEAGDYVLISTGVTLNEDILSKFTLVGFEHLPSAQVTLKLDATSQNIVLNIWGMRALTWTGDNNSSWDNTTSNNWWEAATAGSVIFGTDDGVTFDDSATNRDVTINSAVSPYMMAVDTAATYTFTNTAAGKITGTTNLDKTGTGTLILTGEALHDFTGVVSLLGGTLELSGTGPLLADGGVASMLGASSNAATNLIIAGGTLRLNGTTDMLTDRNFTIGDGGATLDSAAAGKLVHFTNTASISNTGTADNTLTLAGAGDGALALGLVDPSGQKLSLEKTGTGTWTLQGTSSFTGSVTVSGGTLGVGSDAALGNTTSILLNGTTLTNVITTTAIADTAVDVTLSSGKNITLDSVNGGTFLAQTGKTFTINGTVSGGSLTKTGAGKLTLGGTTTYTGDTLIKAGTLALANTGALASNTITVYAGAQLDVSAIASGLTLGTGKTIIAGSDSATTDLKGNYTLAGGTLTVEDILDPGIGKILTIDGSLNITATSELAYILTGNIVGANSQIKVGALDLSATTNLNAQLSDGILSTGSYTLFEYTSLSGNVSNLVYTNSLDARYVLTFKNDTATKRVLMEVSSTSSDNPLTWVGDLSGNVGEWSTAAANFNQEGASNVTYFSGDFAIFDNTANVFDITVGSGGVSLGRATFNNDTSHNYTLSGGEIRGDGYIEKRGNGTLTINNANSFAGKINEDGTRSAGTILVAGTIAVGNDLALGTGSVYLYGGTLQSAGSYTLANNIDLNSGARVTFDSGTGLLGLSGTLTGSNTSTITKTGTGSLAFTGDGSAYQGTLQHTQGDITLGAVNQAQAQYFLSGTGTTLTIDSGTSQIGALVGEAGTTIGGSGTLQVGTLNTNTLYAGDLINSVGITKVGTGTLVLTGQNTNTGDIHVQAGTLQIGNATDSTLGTGSITIDPGATLAFHGTGDLELTQQISGAGSLEKKGGNTLAIAQDNLLTGTVRISDGTLALTGTGTLGTANIINNAALVLDRTGDYTLANTITGSGTITKQDAGMLTYLGNNTATGMTTITNGALILGQNTAQDQTYTSAINLATSAGLLLNPGDGATTTLSSVTGAGTLIQIGDGTSILTGALQTEQAGIINGTLQLGSGSEKTALESSTSIDLFADGTLLVSRTGDTRLGGQLVGDGNLVLQGDKNGSGTLVLANNTNELTGIVSVQKNSILQIGDTSTEGSLNAAGDNVTVNIGQRATLRYTNAGSETGDHLTLTGSGTFDYNGGSTLRFTSDAAAFTGTLQSSQGTLQLDAAQLSEETLNAVNTGVLQVKATTDTTLTNAFGTGTGTITLASASPATPVTYQVDTTSVFGGTLAIATATTLHLADHTVGAKTLALQSGSFLRGNGTIQGDLHNQLGGTIHPGNSVGQINIQGNLINDGTVLLDVDSADSYSTIHYTGTAQLNTSGALQVILTQDTYDNLALGTELKILVDDNTTDGASSVIGNFDLSKVTLLVDGTTLNGQALTYNKGDGGLTLLLASSIRDIPELNLHEGLDGYIAYLDNILHHPTDYPDQITTISGFLGATDISGTFNGASPIGLASLTAMTTAIAHDDAETLRSHLESLRYQRGVTGQAIETMPYIVGTGLFVRNGSGSSNPAFDFNTYGGLIGVDQSFGPDLLMGMNVGYHSGKADLHNGAGKVTLNNASLSVYGSYMFSDWLYLDAGVYGGYNSYEIKHDTLYGRATAKPEGFNYGANLYLGTIVPLSKQFSLTPYAGIEYVRTDVDAFTEKGTQSALHLDSFTQDSLRAKIGTGINWQVPTEANFTLRVGLSAAYAYELLDDEVDMEARFANDYSGNKYKVSAAASPENLMQIGPVIEFGFDENKSLTLGYTFEYDFEDQTAHHLNATFRMRF